MKISAQSENELDAVNASIESTLQRLYHLRRRRNFLASLLLCLPTELILKIFGHAIELVEVDSSSSDDGPTQLVLTAICHQLREIGIASSQLWSTANLTISRIAELFPRRCKYDPHTLITVIKSGSTHLAMIPGGKIPREKLVGCTFKNLRSIVFEVTPSDITRRVIGVLRRAPNISNLDFYYITTPHHGI
jgi:hypothetical protein